MNNLEQKTIVFPIKHLINWYLGNHCLPKCPSEKNKKHKRGIEEIFLNKLEYEQLTYGEFLKIVRGKNVCSLSEAEYRRNVYRELLTGSPKSEKLSEIEALVLALLWIFRFEEKLGNEKIYRSWKGYDFSVLKELLSKGLISYSYQSKSILFRDKGIKQAPKIANKIIEQLKSEFGSESR